MKWVKNGKLNKTTEKGVNKDDRNCEVVSKFYILFTNTMVSIVEVMCIYIYIHVYRCDMYPHTFISVYIFILCGVYLYTGISLKFTIGSCSLSASNLWVGQRNCLNSLTHIVIWRLRSKEKTFYLFYKNFSTL